MTVTIIADGDFPTAEYPRYLVGSADAVVCCDGALEPFLRESQDIFGERRLPDAVVGDMDTLPTGMQKEYEDIIVKVDEQDYNDLTKAFRYTLSRYPSVSEIHIVGATGKREDHTIANVSLLMEYARACRGEGPLALTPPRDIRMDMVSDRTTMFAMAGSGEFDCGEGRSVSLFSPDPTLQIVSEGLEWPLEGVKLDNWWRASLNRATADTVRLRFSHPAVVLIVLN